MGNCLRIFSRRQGNSYESYRGSPPNEEKLVATWKQTGIIGLRDRGLKELSDAVAAVGQDAKVFDGSNNRLTELPPQLQHLTNLQRLVLASNNITDIRGTILIPLSSSLKILILDGNMITALPDEIGMLARLEKLSVKNNNLQQLNPNIGRLRTLQFLNVGHNKLSALPQELSSCEALEELDACENQISTIPSQLGQLQKLKSLNLDSNKVSEVPPAIFIDCVALQTLSLHSNPIIPDRLQETEGFQVFEQRRRQKYSKVIAGGVLMGPRGMDEGIDRKTKQ